MKAKNPGIRLVVYSSSDDSKSQAISASASSLFPASQVRRCRNCSEVADALKGILSGYGIVLMMIREAAELAGMAPLGDRLKDQSVILISDDLPLELTRKALRLYPRYTGSFQDGPGDILMVLERMITKIETTIKGEDDG